MGSLAAVDASQLGFAERSVFVAAAKRYYRVVRQTSTDVML